MTLLTYDGALLPGELSNKSPAEAFSGQNGTKVPRRYVLVLSGLASRSSPAVFTLSLESLRTGPTCALQSGQV